MEVLNKKGNTSLVREACFAPVRLLQEHCGRDKTGFPEKHAVFPLVYVFVASKIFRISGFNKILAT